MEVFEAVDIDRSVIAAMLARAFANDPAAAWIIPDPVSRAASLTEFFADAFDETANGLRFITAGKEAVALWQRPDRDKKPHAPPESPTSEAMRRAMLLQASLEAHRPREAFWYLYVAGCEPTVQGRGLGAAVVRAGLKHTATLPAYLETANARNLPFYQALGFGVIETWHVPDGPRFWSMLRPG